jgi:hypothetical protein
VAPGFTKKIAPKTPVDADLGGAPGGVPKKYTKKGSKPGFSKRGGGLRGGKR